MMIKKPVVLVVMDGVGWTEKDNGNAVLHAYKPQLDELMNKWPHRTIKASGVAVGLPSDSDMGNSEVGHNPMPGRVLRVLSKSITANCTSSAYCLTAMSIRISHT